MKRILILLWICILFQLIAISGVKLDKTFLVFIGGVGAIIASAILAIIKNPFEGRVNWEFRAAMLLSAVFLAYLTITAIDTINALSA